MKKIVMKLFTNKSEVSVLPTGFGISFLFTEDVVYPEWSTAKNKKNYHQLK